MLPDATNTTDPLEPQDEFNIPRWHEGCELWLGFCEQYWGQFVHLRRKAQFVFPLADDEDEGNLPYYDLERNNGKRFPPIVRAVAGFRSSLRYVLDALLPEADLTAGGRDDVERTMAVSAGWEEALKIALDDIDRLKDLVASARPAWGVTVDSDVITILELLRSETDRQVRHYETLARPHLARLSARPLTRTGYTRLPADRINKAVIEALAPGAMCKLPAGYLDIFGPGVRFSRAYAFGTGRRPLGYDQLTGVIGLREELDESQSALLRRGSALAVKIHLALWERAYMEAAGGGTYATRTAPRPCDYVTMKMARLCDDIGLRRKKGAHKRESRESVIGLLKLLTDLEVVCLYKPPRNVPPERLRGPVWKRGILPEELNRSGDVFATGSNDGISAKQAFSYAPGPYYENSVWRGANKYVAQVHAGLLGLSCRNERRWDVMLGAYLCVLARMNRYRKVTLSRRTLVEKVGLRAVYGGKHSSRMIDILEDSLDRLITLGLLKQWRVKEGTEDQMTHSWRWADLWLATKIEFEWPEAIGNRSRLLSRRSQTKRSRDRWE